MIFERSPDAMDGDFLGNWWCLKHLDQISVFWNFFPGQNLIQSVSVVHGNQQ